MNFYRFAFLTLASLLVMPAAAPQTTVTPIAASAPTAVPSLVPFSGTATITEGKAGQATITFQIFKEETAGESLWTETQSVQIDPAGHYKVQLGATSPNGLPADLFTTGEARWLEVQIAGETPQARILLASVPYALKAGDATTLGGLPASAYALAGSKSPAILALPAGATPDANSTVTTPGGTTGYLPMFTGAATIADSILYASSTGIGVGDIPNSTAVFDVNGKSIWRGLLNVSRAGNATASTGYDSYPMFFQASAYNSSTKAAALPAFQLQAEPTGNNTATPAGTFNLLYNSNGGTPTETGLSFNGNGTINFAPGQAFPGTITGVTAGTDLTGTVTNGVATLNLNTAATNALYPQLATSNTFAGTQSFTKVGIGTTTPRSLLEIQAAASAALGPVATLTNTLGGAGAESALDFNTYKPSTTGTYNPMVRIVAQDADHDSDNLLFQFNKPGAQNNGLQTNMAITPAGSVGIGTTTPISTLEIAADAYAALGPVLTLTNTGGVDIFPDGTYQADSVAIDFNVYNNGQDSGNGRPTAEIAVVSDSYNNAEIDFNFNQPSNANTGLSGVAFMDYSGNFNTNGGISGRGIGSYGTGGQSNMYPGDGADFEGGEAIDSTQPNGDGIVAMAGGYDVSPAVGTPGDAGYFEGNVNVTGTVSGGMARTRIDHPLDPANKYLSHASVGSSEQMNIYTGNVVTDELGLATITLPDWFESLNTDFRYQLTVVGQFAQAIVKDKIANKRFTIMTNVSHVEVSWLITAVRHDAYAQANPLIVEQEKPAREKGFYIHPDLYGQPQEKQTLWATHPSMMEKRKAQQENRLNPTSKASATRIRQRPAMVRPVTTTKP